MRQLPVKCMAAVYLWSDSAMINIPVSFFAAAVLAASFFLQQPVLFAQDLPPEEVSGIIGDIVALEEHFEKQEWDKARSMANRIDNELLNLMVKTQLDDLTLEKSLIGLKAALYEGNLAKTEGKFIFFQKSFFTFLNNFSYDVHPILKMIESSVFAESEAALRKKDYQDLANEMAEAGNLVNNARTLLLEKGISVEELRQFNAKIVAVIKAVKRKEFDQVKEKLQEVQELYASFMQRSA